MEIKQYIEENEARFLDELASLIRIPSISALPEHKEDMLACAERWRQLLLEAGADEAVIMPSAGNPLVYAEKRISPEAPTVLIYAHYDVMPAEPLELWKSQPFEPEIRDGRIWARGADDDKGQAMIQVKAFEYMVREGLLRHNVKFIFEGEEEIGSPSLNAFLKEHRELLRADVILVSDTSMLGPDLPSLTTGLRGLAYWEIEVTGPNRDLHSGHFGGAVANPVNVLCGLLAKVTDADGRITVPHFYDEVEPVPEAERRMIASIPFDEEAYKQAIGVKALKGEKGYSTPLVRHLRHLGRLYRRRLEDGAALESVCQGVVPLGASPKPRDDFAPVHRLYPKHRSRIRPSESDSDARRRRLRLPHYASGLSGGGTGIRQSLRQAAVGGTPGRKHPHHQRFRADSRHQDHPDGLRAGERRHPLA